MTGQVSPQFVLKSRAVVHFLAAHLLFWSLLHHITEIGGLLYLVLHGVLGWMMRWCQLQLWLDLVSISVSLTLVRCGALVDARGLYSFACTSALSPEWQSIFIGWHCSPAMKEPVVLACLGEKRPVGLTLVPWYACQPLTWVVTAVASLQTPSRWGSSWVGSSQEKLQIFSLITILFFQAIAVEITGVFNCSRRISSSSSEERESLFLSTHFYICIYMKND